MSFISSSGATHRQFGRHFGNRETGGFSTPNCRGAGYARVHFDNDQTTVFGFTANWTLEPPVSTPFLQHRHRGVTHDWYSLSVGHAGATVMESPVWMPIASKFSMERTMMQLSFYHAPLPSRTLSSRQRFVNQQLVGWREVQTAFADFFELFTVYA